MPRTLRSLFGLVAAGVLAAGCASSDDGTAPPRTDGVTASSEAITTSTPSTAAETIPAMEPTTIPATTSVASVAPTTPATFAEAVALRLEAELGEPALAAELVSRLGPETLGAMEAAIGIDAADESVLLAIAPPTVASSEVDALVVYAFGNRMAADGSLSAGPMNEALAEVTAAFVGTNPVPVYAQWEVADLLISAGVPDVISIGREVDAAGNVTYLSTAGVAEKAVALAAAAERPLGQVGVIGFRDHAVRCVLTSRTAGMTDAAVPVGVTLPGEYDPESGQPWTRNRLDYLSVDLPARLAVWP